MFKFYAQPHSEIPASIQLLNQISFAIACGQYAPGYRLPSTRQLAMQTGLHRNTISKVYRQLEEMGLVETRASSGIYVRSSAELTSAIQNSPLVQQTEAYQLVRQGLDQLLNCGCSLTQARDLFLAEIEWRLRCRTQVWVTVPERDQGTGQLMIDELQPHLQIPLQLVPLEELDITLQQAQLQSGTLLTIRNFLSQVEAVATPWSIRVLPVEIYNFEQEVDRIRNLPTHSCVGLISLSYPILEVSTVIVHSIRGDDLLTLTAVVTDLDQLRRLVRRSQVIFCDSSSYTTVKAVVREARSELIRLPEVIPIESYVSQDSIKTLKRELGLDQA